MADLEKELNLKKTFAYPTYEEWRLEAEWLLKGAPFDKILTTDTVEGITLKAIYNKEDIADIPFVNTTAGAFPFVKGNTETDRVENGWEIKTSDDRHQTSDIIDISIYNGMGSSAVDDLGLMASSIVEKIEEMRQSTTTNPLSLIPSLNIIFAVNNNLFMEIAKLRAARYIFAKLAEAYGIPPEKAKVKIHCRTSEYTKTYYDPWVNILRTSTEAFSAVVGGCDSLYVTPFDVALGEADDFSKRIARNQQLILLEEAHLNAVNDPAGGSYYVEALTFELVKKGWELFLEIEDKGGLSKCLENGFIAEKIEKSHQYRVKNAETRKDAIVGTSTFPNLSEKRPIKASPVTAGGDKGGAIKTRRLSQSWENLRQSVEAINPRPKVFVANIGKVVKNKPRVDFCLGYFEPAGFICETNDGFDSVAEALEYVNKCDAQVIVLCSTDDRYPEIVPEFAQKFASIRTPNTEHRTPKTLILAGYPKDHIETFTQAGIDFFIYMRQNVVQTIKEILRKGEIK